MENLQSLTDGQKKAIGTGWTKFLKDLVPLVTTLIGALLAGLLGGDSSVGSAVGAVAGIKLGGVVNV